MCRKGVSFEGFNEYGEAIMWAQWIKELLQDDAVLVPFGFLKNKVAFINGLRDITLAIEIHFNSAVANGKRVGEGSETLYYPGSVRGEEIARDIQHTLSSIFKPDRGIKEGYYQMNKAKGADFFLARTRCTSLILEPEFIRHKEKIQDNREAACCALASALIKY